MADRGGHIERGAGERTAVVTAGAVDDMDRASLQQERGIGCADHRHGIRDQHKSIMTFAAQGDLERDGIDVKTIDDESAPPPRTVKSGDDYARLPWKQF